jgi:hypothetical protein
LAVLVTSFKRRIHVGGSEEAIMAAFDYATEAQLFDYNTEAELFPTRSRKSRRSPFGYRRFARAADAIRFAIEDMPPELLLGAYLEVDERRYDSEGIRRLYDSEEYPLTRRTEA